MQNTLIPDTHLDLVTAAGVAAISTLGPEQSIQSSLVWFDYENDEFTINVVDNSAKAKNLARHPKATLLIMDRRNEDRYLSVRCEVGRIERDGALSHLNMLTRRNMDHDSWYGDAVENDPAEAARRIIVCLRPVRIYCGE